MTKSRHHAGRRLPGSAIASLDVFGPLSVYGAALGPSFGDRCRRMKSRDQLFTQRVVRCEVGNERDKLASAIGPSDRDGCAFCVQHLASPLLKGDTPNADAPSAFAPKGVSQPISHRPYGSCSFHTGNFTFRRTLRCQRSLPFRELRPIRLPIVFDDGKRCKGSRAFDGILHVSRFINSITLCAIGRQQRLRCRHVSKLPEI